MNTLLGDIHKITDRSLAHPSVGCLPHHSIPVAGSSEVFLASGRDPIIKFSKDCSVRLLGSSTCGHSDKVPCRLLNVKRRHRRNTAPRPQKSPNGSASSLGQVGPAYGNSMMESFWGRVQTELLNRRGWRTRLELASALFDDLEVLNNKQRRHRSLGMLIRDELKPFKHRP